MFGGVERGGSEITGDISSRKPGLEGRGREGVCVCVCVRERERGADQRFGLGSERSLEIPIHARISLRVFLVGIEGARHRRPRRYSRFGWIDLGAQEALFGHLAWISSQGSWSCLGFLNLGWRRGFGKDRDSERPNFRDDGRWIKIENVGHGTLPRRVSLER